MSNLDEEYRKLNELTGGLKKEADVLRKEKENWFRKKEELKEEVNKKIKEIKNLNYKEPGKLILILKKERDRFNKHVKSLINKLRSVRKRHNPEKIPEQIKSLEGKIEVETNFKKEQQLMEEIKKLKKEHEELAKEKSDKKEIQKEIEESKKKADEAHNKIKEMTENEDRKKFVLLSKEINRLKKEQEDAFSKFIEFKNQFNSNSKELRKENDKLAKLEKKLGKIKNKPKRKPEIKKTKEEKSIIKGKKIIEKKIEKVEEKIKRGEKLTTEDLIVLQGKEDDSGSGSVDK